MKKLHTLQFSVKGNANLGLKVNKFIQANDIELADISQLSFNNDHTSAILVFISDKTKFASEPAIETE